MLGMNGMGPEGKGPGTGRGKGRCRKGKNNDSESQKAGGNCHTDFRPGRGRDKKKGLRKR